MLKCINPATGQVIERVQCDDRRTVHEKFQKLQEGHDKWRQRPRQERVRLIERFGKLLEKRQEEQARGLTREVGKPIRQARREVEQARRQVGALVAHERERMDRDASSGRPSQRKRVECTPLGVVAHISTWDFPVLAGIQMMLPALLAGNSVMYKPSAHATLVGRLLVGTMREAGLPKGAVDMVVGAGAVGDYLLDEAISGLVFSGSYATGRNVCEKIASRMIPRHMELKSKDGIYVCDDVEEEWVAGKIAGQAMYNAGQSRGTVERIYVHRAAYHRIVQALCRCVSAHKLGSPDQEATSVGPLASKQQVNALEYQIGDALQKGAQILTGGRVDGGKGNFFQPTVLVDTDHRMLVMREDTLGPVLCVQSVADDDEALQRLEDTDYGVTAAVFSQSRSRACTLLGELDVDQVYWNGYHGACPPIATDGQYYSGPSSDTSRPAMHWFTRAKSWRLPPS